MESIEETRDKDTIGVDIIDPINIESVEVPEEANTEPTSNGTIPDVKPATGKIIGLLFDIVAGIRGKEFWKLNKSEEKSVNKICPQILPKAFTEKAGLIGCVVTLLSIVLKRIKLEKAINEQVNEQVSEQVDEQVEPDKALTGGRND